LADEIEEKVKVAVGLTAIESDVTKKRTMPKEQDKE